MDDLRNLTVREIGERFGGMDGLPGEELLATLEGDGRAGVRRIAAGLRGRAERRARERRRIDAMLERERALWAGGVSYIAGIDEVGVGPFAGPVVAAAVVFSPGIYFEGIRDSKRLSHKQRVKLDGEIRRTALGVGVGLVDVEEIDRLNILQASLKAMRLALVDMGIKVQHVLVDGREIPGIGIPQDAIAGGDDSVFSIAAASIVAKVHRDGLMVAYDSEFPRYGFSRHKGYGTAEHIRALKQHGPCEIHRKSFSWQEARRGR